MDRIVSGLVRIVFLYTPKFTINLVYMLQSVEYNVRDFMAWMRRNPDLRFVQKRRSLVWTSKAVILVLLGWGIGAVALIVGIIAILQGLLLIGIVCILLCPVFQVIILVVGIKLGYVLVQQRQERKIISKASKILSSHPGVKIAIAGSYGKTTMKEILRTILDEGLHVAASHGNMNTPLGISRLANKLDGSEDVLIFEYGEERPGDVQALAKLTHPDIGIMTGISLAHLSSFKTIDRIADTIFELAAVPSVKRIYKNLDDPELKKRSQTPNEHDYTVEGVGEWRIETTAESFDGMDITATKDETVIKAHTALVGRHLCGPLVAAIAIADSLDVSPEKIQQGIERTKPFSHRMQPYALAGALVIDDTYNGNPEGVKAGLRLLKQAEARRRIYVTPGLVEQGDQTVEVHVGIGELIADSADVVVLMKNSVTEHIKLGLERGQFAGKLIEIDDPLSFYSHLNTFVAKGDVVLMQNDWTDNYF